MEITSATHEDLTNLGRWQPDYIVIGCGTAGSVVAARLAENSSHKILVLEMGGQTSKDPAIETPGFHEFLWDHPSLRDDLNPGLGSFVTTKQQGRSYAYPRALGAGGSVSHHSEIDGIGSPHIYNEIAKRVQDDRWNYPTVKQYCKKMEKYNVPASKANLDFHGSRGWLEIKRAGYFPPIQHAFVQAAQKVTGAPFQKDLNGKPEDCVGLGESDMQIDHKGLRSYSYKDLLKPLLEKEQSLKKPSSSSLLWEEKTFPRLVILFHATVTQLILTQAEGKKTKKVKEVEIVYGTNLYQADKAYVASRDPAIFHCAQLSSVPSSVPLPTLRYRFQARKEIILCGGAINTPQLLLLSGIGPPEHLRQMGIPLQISNVHVGQHVMDHHEVGINFEIDPKKFIWGFQAGLIHDNIKRLFQGFQPLAEPNPENPSPVLLSSRERAIYTSEKSNERKNLESLWSRQIEPFYDKDEKKEGPNMMIFDWHSSLNKDAPFNKPDLHFTSAGGLFFDFNFKCQDPLPDGKTRATYIQSQFDPRDPSFVRVFHRFLLETLVLSKANGSIQLASKNPLACPLIDLKLHEDEVACQRLALGVQLIRKIVNTEPLSDFYLKNNKNNTVEILPGTKFSTLEDLVKYMKTWSAIGHHISGTARMGLSAEDSVCDSELKVFQVENLRIVDASIYPTLLLHGYNPSRGVYIIAELASDMILGRISKKS